MQLKPEIKICLIAESWQLLQVLQVQGGIKVATAGLVTQLLKNKYITKSGELLTTWPCSSNEYNYSFVFKHHNPFFA